MRLCREHREEGEEGKVEVEERRAGRVLFGAGGKRWGGGKRQLWLKKKERKLLPNTVEQEEGLGAANHSPERERGGQGL